MTKRRDRPQSPLSSWYFNPKVTAAVNLKAFSTYNNSIIVSFLGPDGRTLVNDVTTRLWPLFRRRSLAEVTPLDSMLILKYFCGGRLLFISSSTITIHHHPHHFIHQSISWHENQTTFMNHLTTFILIISWYFLLFSLFIIWSDDKFLIEWKIQQTTWGQSETNSSGRHGKEERWEAKLQFVVYNF